jgi:hypothetical protein
MGGERLKMMDANVREVRKGGEGGSYTRFELREWVLNLDPNSWRENGLE